MGHKQTFAVGLDVGSERTRCVIGVLEYSALRLIGFGESDSMGWTKGRIADQKAVGDSISQAVREAEHLAQITAQSAVAGVGGSTVRGANSRSVIEVGRPREMEKRDVSRAMQRA